MNNAVKQIMRYFKLR